MQLAIEKLGMPGRILGSKSGYRDRYPENLAVFNANLCLESGKIWYGDIDVTLQKESLAELSAELEQPLYVLYEMDGRFENEDSPRLSKAVVVFYPDGSHELSESVKRYFTL